MNLKPNPDLWLLDLTPKVAGWPETLIFGTCQSLRLVTADMYIFSVKL